MPVLSKARNVCADFFSLDYWGLQRSRLARLQIHVVSAARPSSRRKLWLPAPSRRRTYMHMVQGNVIRADTPAGHSLWRHGLPHRLCHRGRHLWRHRADQPAASNGHRNVQHEGDATSTAHIARRCAMAAAVVAEMSPRVIRQTSVIGYGIAALSTATAGWHLPWHRSRRLDAGQPEPTSWLHPAARRGTPAQASSRRIAATRARANLGRTCRADRGTGGVVAAVHGPRRPRSRPTLPGRPT